MCDVKCRLETKELWAKFHELGTEMIITKTGRFVIIIIVYLFSLFSHIFNRFIAQWPSGIAPLYWPIIREHSGVLVEPHSTCLSCSKEKIAPSWHDWKWTFNHKTNIHIRITCPWHVYPWTPLLYSKTGVWRGIGKIFKQIATEKFSILQLKKNLYITWACFRNELFLWPFCQHNARRYHKHKHAYCKLI